MQIGLNVQLQSEKKDSGEKPLLLILLPLRGAGRVTLPPERSGEGGQRMSGRSPIS